MIDDQVLTAIRGNENAVSLYRQLEGDRSQWQITVGLIFAVLALLLLMAAIWVAIISATNLVKPILRLVEAAQRLGSGDLATRVKTGKRDDELGELSRTFNTMALRLQTQQVELVATNQQLDDRRRFTELVLSGVSAGVIGLNEHGEIELPNRSASELLGRNMIQHVGQRAGRPGAGNGRAGRAGAKPARRHAPKARSTCPHGPVTRTLHVRVVSERSEGDHTRIVVTFDDVTELLAAQRKAAWSDIARRIAHEIKNPLTPIQLSAERLKRKYLKADRQRSGDLRGLYRYDRAPGGRHRTAGGRVLVLRAHAGAGAPAGGPGGTGAPGGLPAAERQSRDRLRRRSAGDRRSGPIATPRRSPARSPI